VWHRGGESRRCPGSGHGQNPEGNALVGPIRTEATSGEGRRRCARSVAAPWLRPWPESGGAGAPPCQRAASIGAQAVHRRMGREEERETAVRARAEGRRDSRERCFFSMFCLWEKTGRL
jgi:hypothetical protein